MTAQAQGESPVDQHDLFIGLGELLWDLLPSGKQMGGAPANFAYHAQQLGNPAAVATRVGNDPLGRELLERLDNLGIDATSVQIDQQHPTSTVQVTLDPAGQPSYTIVENVAWDFMSFSQQWQALARRAGVVCFGSLVQRSAPSRDAVLAFLEATPDDCLRVFDVNLRQHYYTPDVLRGSLAHANIAKLNDTELPEVCTLLDCRQTGVIDSARTLINRFELDLVCVTRGDHGSILITATDLDEHPGFQVDVADTVGAGDAFTAALAHSIRKNLPLQTANLRANRLGAFVASQSGATPQLPPNLKNTITH